MASEHVWSGPQSFLIDDRTPILGRDREIAELESCLADRTTRLVTITGPGGIGKTRLALHVASRLSKGEGDSRIVFVPLAAIREPHLVLLAIGQALDAGLDDAAEYEQRLVTYLQASNVLLVLDNLEQVLDAGPVLGRILRHSPSLKILATSQAPLAIRGEQLFPLMPLTTPAHADGSIDILLGSDAVTLFVQCALALNPQMMLDVETVQAIAAICRRLDGMPLAIELAAARTNLLSPQQMLGRLDNQMQILGQQRTDIPDRFRTMRSAIAWSYDLLDANEQRLFRALSVFLGGFSLDAVTAMGQSATDELQVLIERSLVQRSPGASGDLRFLMLEPLREFGLDRLRSQPGEENALRESHTRFVVRLTESADTQLIGSNQREWFKRIDNEMDNIRAAIAWSLATGRGEYVMRICSALSVYLRNRGLANESSVWLTQALGMQDFGSPHNHTRALITAGALFEARTDYSRAAEYYRQAQQLAVAIGDIREEIRALNGMGSVACDQSDIVNAKELLERALELSERSNDRRGLMVAQDNLAVVAYKQGRIEDAVQHYQAVIPLLAEFDDISAQSVVFGNLGTSYYLLGQADRAITNVRHAIALQRESGNQRDLPMSLNNLGMILLEQGDFPLAHEAIEEAIAIHKREGGKVKQSVATHSLATLALAEGKTREAASLILECIGLLAGQELPYRFLEISDLLAEICLACDQANLAAELLGAGHRLREDYEIERLTTGQVAREQHMASVREMLGIEVFEEAWNQGAAMDLTTMRVRMQVIARSLVGKQFSDPVRVEETEQYSPIALYGLTERELQVLHLLIEGKSTSELSSTLSISPHTASTHISNIMAKMNVGSRTAAVALALRHGVR